MITRSLFVFVLLAVHLRAVEGQNLILNPEFNALPGLDGNGGNSYNALVENWDDMPYWEPPKKTYDALGNVGTADFYGSFFRSPPYCAHTGVQEYIVGEVPSGLHSGHLYYFSLYSNTIDLDNKKIDVFFSQNRSRQSNSYSPIHFKPGDDVMSFKADALSPISGDTWRRMAKTFTAYEDDCDRITIGILAPQGGGGGDDDVERGAIDFDDLKLIDLGPGGYCPDIRLIQNIVYEDEVIVYKASNKIIAGRNVGATYTSIGPVTVGGTSNITYRAGEEVILQDGFSVEAGATFHAFIAPCECETPVANAGEDIGVCEVVYNDGAVHLGGGAQPDMTYQWTAIPEQGMDFISDPVSPNPTFSPGENSYSGTYTFTLTATNLCLESVTDNVSVTFISSIDNTVDLEVVFSVHDQFYVGLNIVPEPTTQEIIIEHWWANGTQLHDSYTLSVDDDFTLNTPFSWELPEKLNGCVGHRIVVKTRNLCSDIMYVTEYAHPIVYTAPGVYNIINNVFSPDGDGINDAIILEHDNGWSFFELFVWVGGGQQGASGNTDIHHAYGTLYPSPMILWDGSNHTNATTYFFRLHLARCFENPSDAYPVEGYWTMLGPSGKLEDPDGGGYFEDGGYEFSLFEGFANPPEAEAFNIHPNPNSGTFTISGTDMQQITIMEASGKLVRQMAGPFGTAVEVSGLSAGLYVVRVQMADGGVETGRVVVAP